MDRGQASKIINLHCLDLGLKTDSIGYLKTSEENLISPFSNWNSIKEEINKGQGSELKPNQYGLISFNAVHSSSALCVNAFAPFKLDLNFPFAGFTGVKVLSFEKKLPTGISTPNLDLYLETENEMVGVESKFIEILSSKLPNEGGNLEAYINRIEGLNFQSEQYELLMKHYLATTNKMYLDVAQLLKHILGLLNSKNNPKELKPVLVYIYWMPNNWRRFREYRQHEREVQEFTQLIKQFIDFRSFNYSDFMESQIGVFKWTTHIERWKKRYEIDL